MSVLLLDPNIVSILFNQQHPLRDACILAASGHELAISFMSRPELLLWPSLNRWGAPRRQRLLDHMSLYTVLYPDERTCDVRADVVSGCRSRGRPIQTADAWIAATALQWRLPLVTADARDFEAVERLDFIPVR